LKGNLKYLIFFFLIFIVAGIVRTTSLTLRPMHTDEAVHAFKFAGLIEKGIYIYDKKEYHGPTLNYFTLIPALLRSQKTLPDIGENTLRIVPVCFGMGIILLLLLLVKPFGWPFVLKMTVLTAVSPALFFYSRYYIQEILLAFFNFGLILSAFRYTYSRKTRWVISTGIFAGLMLATKETWLLFIFIQLIALLIVLLNNGFVTATAQIVKLLKSWHFYLFMLITGIIYVLFFSSFFMNPGGIADSILTFKEYLSRGGGQSLHNHPFRYYFEVLTDGSCPRNLFRADFWLLLGGTAGCIRLLFYRQTKDPAWLFLLFIGLSTILSFIIFSVIPYKTPWNILSIVPGLIILTTYALSAKNNFKVKTILYIVLAVVLIHSGFQVYSDNFVNYSKQCNSFVYAHPTNDIYRISDEVHKIAKALPPDESFYMNVIVQDHEYWPLPWYLRDITQIGWFGRIDFGKPSAPLILTTSPNPDLEKKLFELPPPGERFLYIPVFLNDLELRPNQFVNIYLRKDYWDKYMAGRVGQE
jgi:uncharacterized protein (TIGR03663 family)